MNVEKKFTLSSDDVLTDRSETTFAFKALQEQLKSNPKLDFVEGFLLRHKVNIHKALVNVADKDQEDILKNKDGRLEIVTEKFIMFVSPKKVIRDYAHMYFFLKNLDGRLEKNFATDTISNPISWNGKDGETMSVGEIVRKKILYTGEKITTYNFDVNLADTLPNIDLSPFAEKVCLVRSIAIPVFPDNISAIEDVELFKTRLKSGQDYYGNINPEQFKRFGQRHGKKFDCAYYSSSRKLNPPLR